MKLALGTVQFGLDYGISNNSGIVEIKEINKILNTAKQNGINLLDTAQGYGKSEEKIGQANSTGFEIITKLKHGFNVNFIRESIENSLKSLNRKKLNGILFHDFNDFKKNPQSLKILNSIKEEGTINKIGFSLYYPRELEFLFQSEVEFNIVQIPFSIFDQRFKPLFSELKMRNIEIHVRSVFLQGLVFINPEEMTSHFRGYVPHFMRFRKTVKKSNSTIIETCLNYVCSQSKIDKVIIGVFSEKELLMNIEAIQTNSLKLERYYEDFERFSIKDEKIILPFNWKK